MNALDLSYDVDMNIIPVVFKGEVLYFSTIHLCENSSGNDIHLVKDDKGNWRMLEIGWEPDCDGSFYWGEFKDSIDLKDYTIQHPYHINKELLWNLCMTLLNIDNHEV